MDNLIEIKANIGDTVFAGDIECEVVELSIRKERVTYFLKNKKGNPFDGSSTAWFFESEFDFKTDKKTIGFKVSNKKQ